MSAVVGGIIKHLGPEAALPATCLAIHSPLPVSQTESIATQPTTPDLPRNQRQAEVLQKEVVALRGGCLNTAGGGATTSKENTGTTTTQTKLEYQELQVGRINRARKPR